MRLLTFWMLLAAAPPAAAAASDPDLLQIAVDRHMRASETGKPGDYAWAIWMYEGYLTLFPAGPERDEVRWYWADALLQAGRLDEAAAQYADLAARTDHPFGELAMYRLVLARRQQVVAAHGTPTDRPATAADDGAARLPSGGTRPLYALDAAHLAYVQAIDALLAADLPGALARLQQQAAAAPSAGEREFLAGQAEELAYYSKSLEKNRPALLYESAQILYNHGRFDEARPRFQQIIDTWPAREEAAFSAALIIDSYVAEENLEEARRYAALFAPPR